MVKYSPKPNNMAVLFRLCYWIENSRLLTNWWEWSESEILESYKAQLMLGQLGRLNSNIHH